MHGFTCTWTKLRIAQGVCRRNFNVYTMKVNFDDETCFNVGKLFFNFKKDFFRIDTIKRLDFNVIHFNHHLYHHLHPHYHHQICFYYGHLCHRCIGVYMKQTVRITNIQSDYELS